MELTIRGVMLLQILLFPILICSPSFLFAEEVSPQSQGSESDFASSPSNANATVSSVDLSIFSSIDLAILSKALGEGISKVEEFRFLKEQAERMDLRVYLFGGTAAAYAHYVKWDLMRQQGDESIQADRFDYDYTNIFRSTQDLDLVIDGSAEQAKELEDLLAQQFPYFVGNKKAWEVRPLSEDMGMKKALLHDPDFQNQHTDSHSTGVIEVTSPKPGEPIVRDIRDWDSITPHFMEDVIQGKITYYFSETHGDTEYAKRGDNPEIFSAIRLLTKAFQYKLKITDQDLAKVQEVIQRFDPAQDIHTSYAKGRIQTLGTNVIRHAVDLEYAANMLERLGLKDKLLSIGSRSKMDSMAWWVNKEPLRSQPVGEGEGATAHELGIEIVAHETNNFLAYESITRSHTGEPNVFISRQGFSEESAAKGDGFYTKMGKDGARGTGLTIRFKMRPEAREGTDFIVNRDFVIVRNKKVLEVIHESLNIGLYEYLEMISKDSSIFKNDKGLLEKLKRKISRSVATSNQEIEKSAEFIRSLVQLDANNFAVKEWFLLPYSLDYPDLVESMIEAGTQDKFIVESILSRPHWAKYPSLVHRLIQNGKVDGLIVPFILSQPHWTDHPELVEEMLRKGNLYDFTIIRYVISQPHWAGYPQWVEALILKGKEDYGIAQFVLSRPHWADYPHLVESLIQNGMADKEIAAYTLSQSHWTHHPYLIEMLIQNGKANRQIVEYVLPKSHWANHPELLRATGGKKVTIENLQAAFANGFTFNKQTAKLSCKALF